MLDAQAIDEAVDRTYHDLPPVGDLDQRVYAAFARYAFDEAEAWPSHDRIAWELGCWRETVTRAVGRLVRAGWMIVKERRWSWRSGWLHNVYELLAPFCVSELAVKAITRRAHNTARKMARRVRRRLEDGSPLRPDHTNPKGWCGCGLCRTDRTQIGRPPPRVMPLDAVGRGRKMRAERMEENLREEVRKINRRQGGHAPGSIASAI